MTLLPISRFVFRSFTQVAPLACLPLLLLLAGCGSGTAPVQDNPQDNPKSVTSIAVTPSGASLAIGATQQLTATATYSDQTTANVTATVSWMSANAAFATVNSAGLATGVGAGSTSVTASLSGVSGTDMLTVAAAPKTVTSIAVTPSGANVAVGATQQLTATATYSDGTTANVTTTVSWTSANAAFATVNSAGLATGVGAGSTSVTASLSGVSGSAMLAVMAAPAKTLASIAVTAASGSIVAGATDQFIATATYSDQTTANVTTAVSWTSSSAAAATVNPAGLATGVAAGSTTIAASLSGVSGSAMLAVTAAPAKTLASIAVTAASGSIVAGATDQFIATATYSDQTTANVTTAVSWTSSSAAAATVNSAGVATGVAAGSTTIAASLSGVSGSAMLAVTAAPAKTVTSIAVTAASGSIVAGATDQFIATATYSDHTTADVSSSATWTAANTAVATVNPLGLATGVASGSTSITAALSGVSGNTSLAVTMAPVNGVNITTWHADNNRSGLNAGEQSLSPSNVTPQTFGKLFSYLVDGYVYGEPLLMSNVTVNGSSHNVLYAATEHDSVYAFDADSYGTGTPLWQVSLLQSGETPLINASIKPFLGVTSTPVIDSASNTMYVVSAQTSSANGSTFRLSALDITTGAQKFGGPVTIQAAVAGTNSDAVNGMVHLTNSCVQRAALLLENGTIYIGFGSCHSGWLLAYDAQKLTQTGVFNASPNLNGEGPYASAGGIWMGAGGPVADSAGNIYAVTGNGPWDGQTAWSDSVLKFNSKLQVLDYFTPSDYAFMNCKDSDLAAGGLLLIPGTSQALTGGKTGRLYMVNTANLGHEQAGDAGATQTLYFESDLVTPYSTSCTDPGTMNTHLSTVNSYENFGTAAYFNGSVYLGITPTAANIPSGIRQFTYSTSSTTLTAGAYATQGVQQSSYGTTPFVSANGTASGVVWMVDHGFPLQTPAPAVVSVATLRAYDANDLTKELYDSGTNSGDIPGYGIKFTSPIVANGKVYFSTGHDLSTITNPQGELDVYGLK